MIEWWNSLDTMMKILWAITLASSLIFVIQTVMTFLGASHDGDFDINTDADAPDIADTDGDATVDHSTGMNLLTLRNFVNFFLGFGWTAVLLRGSVASTGLLMVISIIVGAVLVFLVMMLFRGLARMQQSGNINIFKSAIGCQGTVYLTIPAGRSGEGKVQIVINEAVREYDAVTDGDELRTGTAIHVVNVVNTTTLLVEPNEVEII
ncbi:MAG: NfeD family protein [Bacteroidales bacterium]|nr:NfeD family protein [Bacteroidales bacterium]